MAHEFPGLISRTFEKTDDPNIVRMTEKWDVTVPGCPMVVYDLQVWQKNDQVQTVERRQLVPSNFAD